ncbi:MAG: DUF2934 domain-containing protein [Candidatus Omnitrophica bacterium]|nr:DUF2934 domain-containing protein [Candidatus Omnitrophota bacterium]
MAKVFSKTSVSTAACSQKDMKDLIAKKAYDLYVKSGCKSGHDLDNWVKAEKIVKSECCK